VQLVQIETKERNSAVVAEFSAEPLKVERLGDVEVEPHGDVFLLSKPSVGALSVVDQRDLVAFQLFYPLRHDVKLALEAVQRLYARLTDEDEEAAALLLASELVGRLKRDGWTRKELPRPDHEPLQAIYFTVTRSCDLACPYCYQGLANRGGTDMSLDQAKLALEKIARVNAGCKIIVTGGEPFSNPAIFDILDEIDKRGFRSVILTNGTFINDAAVHRLRGLRGLLHLQMSLDGITEQTHALTRGRGHFQKAMKALENIIEQRLPFILSPTMHDGNLHEIYDIAALAIGNNGWCSPNNLREFPHEGLNFKRVHLSNERCLEVLDDMNKRLVERFGLARMADLSARYKGPSLCSVMEPNANFICGMAHSLMDLDWNGDIYPCHLSKGPELVLGNLFVDDFDDIFTRVKERGIRVQSHEIPKCSGCKFVSTCGGGCRAGAWFAYGSVAREDGLCDLNYSSRLHSILVGAAAWYPTGETVAQ
jgi:radical SAM protein with 4Fe4S-binding SPASM domain